ncbi:YdgH/BhsA/McbA family protein [Aurantiacibacter spongiae]|uniref:Uncharacterized protein n=1 Tax=Aurantiacibacter spongiae TaxID=2488860 RepID=A0A3N5DNU0_9SPHN|nr:hypothetical protein [Aurantiacibacter spongiae]RPF70751.1 hypothetical protein EG799_03280 [Aurantiacibacter spongiae]
MKMIRCAVAAIALSVAVPGAVAAQDIPMVPGEYVEVAGIEIADGHTLDYVNYLAGQYRRELDFAVERGYISSYEVLFNEYPRQGEPDMYLVTRYETVPNAEESMRQMRERQEYLQRNLAQLEAESGERATYRTVMFSQLLRKYEYAN